MIIVNDSSNYNCYKVTDHEMHQFRQALWQFVDNDFVDVDLPSTRFDKFGFHLGYLAITYSNIDSKLWLSLTAVPNLKVWNEDKLRAIEKSTLPKFVKLSVYGFLAFSRILIRSKVVKRVACYNNYDLYILNWQLFKHFKKKKPILD